MLAGPPRSILCITGLVPVSRWTVREGVKAESRPAADLSLTPL